MSSTPEPATAASGEHITWTDGRRLYDADTYQRGGEPLPTTAAVCPCGATLPVEGVSGLLRAIADHIERGDEFRDGQWVACAPVTGDGEKWPWQRKPFVGGVTIAREVQVEQLRRLADWHWSPDE